MGSGAGCGGHGARRGARHPPEDVTFNYLRDVGSEKGVPRAWRVGGSQPVSAERCHLLAEHIDWHQGSLRWQEGQCTGQEKAVDWAEGKGELGTWHTADGKDAVCRVASACWVKGHIPVTLV